MAASWGVGIRVFVFGAVIAVLSITGPRFAAFLRAHPELWVITSGSVILAIGIWCWHARKRIRWVAVWTNVGITVAMLGIAIIVLELEWSGPKSIEFWHWLLFITGGWWIAHHWTGAWPFWGPLTIGWTFTMANELLQAFMVRRIGDPRDVLMDLAAWGVGLIWANRPPIRHIGEADTRERRCHPLPAVLGFGGWILCAVLATRWLVGWTCLPYPREHPVVCLPSGYTTHPPPPRTFRWMGIDLQNASRHELQRIPEFQREAPDCVEWIEAARTFWYARVRPLPPSTMPLRPCSLPLWTRVRRVWWIVLVCGGVVGLGQLGRCMISRQR